ncbi:MAG TPA: NAD(P)H-flavin reductase [Motiliproteus sp.]
MNTPKQQLPQTVKIQAHVIGVQALSAHSFEVQLDLPSTAEFLAGQYLELILADGRAVPYSIASAPARLPRVELHILDQGAASLSRQVLDYLRSQEVVTLRMPSGSCVLQPERLGAESELVLIAAGSGFAQMKAIMEQVVAEGLSNPVHLYWGVKQADQLYGEALIQQWSATHPSFRYVPVVEQDDSWSGRRGYVHQAVLADFDRLDRAEVFVCGSPVMVYAVEDDFLPQGLRQGHIHSDVFSYAPRSGVADS